MKLKPADQIYGQAKSVDRQDPCPSCKDHPAVVFEDGSRYCAISGESFVATGGELLEMRRAYEAKLLAAESN
ncbi:MAG: hypothetical protein WC028_28195 [Candidatus Obscuribacterales bacterium]|jgi:hypothetical protein